MDISFDLVDGPPFRFSNMCENTFSNADVSFGELTRRSQSI
jgi:hypothetical protein